MCIWHHLELHEDTLDNGMFMSAGCQDIVSIWKRVSWECGCNNGGYCSKHARDVHLIQYDTTEHIAGFLCEATQITSALLVLNFIKKFSQSQRPMLMVQIIRPVSNQFTIDYFSQIIHTSPFICASTTTPPPHAPKPPPKSPPPKTSTPLPKPPPKPAPNKKSKTTV
ncbi:hypothetical protein F2Q70_00008567 [Brassica cretica]|uniref:Uncharacterized protein n=1 Tax=Brassica cretica TaxID=69181 RepID=A0A8S9LZN2_BRACR|nr:hypothetical protein F2Q70_00008567 [Brassica cretica]